MSHSRTLYFSFVGSWSIENIESSKFNDRQLLIHHEFPSCLVSLSIRNRTGRETVTEIMHISGLPRWLSGKEPTCQRSFDP